MKNKLGLLLSIFLAGCIFDTEDPKPNPKPIPTNTIVHKTITNVDTVKNVYHTMNISGKVSEKNSSGKTVGGIAAVVCLENSGKCVKTNSNGQYSFRNTKTSSIAGRMFQESDTAQTPETIDTTTISDTTIVKDTTIVQDTIVRNDSTIIVDSIQIVETVNIDSDTTNSDTAIVYKDSKALYEIPVNSWKEVLPEKYIVQRNISIDILDTSFIKNIKNAEMVYWKDGSQILVIRMGTGGSRGSFSGFLYTLYDDSSKVYDIKNKNVYIRLVDSNDVVYASTNVIEFSESSGNITLKDIEFIPQIPKDNIYYLRDEDDYVEIQDTTSISNINSVFSEYAFDEMYSIDTNRSESRIEYVFHKTTNDFWKSNRIDSILITFNSNNVDTLSIFKISKPVFYDSNYVHYESVPPFFYYHEAMNVVPGLNKMSFKWSNDFVTEDENGDSKFYVSLSGVLATNIDVTLIFKKP